MRLPFLILPLFVLVLGACTGPTAGSRTYSYSPPPTPGGRLCSSQCREAKDYCRETCSLQQRACANNVQAQAMRDYDRYMRQEFFRSADPHNPRDPQELHMRDFERMQPCLDARDGCNDACESPYQTCYENCGGKVSVTTSCQFLCF